MARFYEQYLEYWIAAFLGHGSKRGKEISRKKMEAVAPMAVEYLMQLKREEGGA